MKYTTIFTALALSASLMFHNSCRMETGSLGEVPVVTEDMYSIEVASDGSGTVSFEFTGSGMTPYWEINRSEDNVYTSTERSFTLTFPLSGTYTGSISAYGPGGMGNSLDFSFSVEVTVLSENERILTAHSWKITDYGWYGDGWEYFMGEVPDFNSDDILTFNEDHSFTLDVGDTPKIYRDDSQEYEYTPTGNESWVLMEDGSSISLQFGGGGFPGMLSDDTGIDGLYSITTLTDNEVRIEFWQENKGQYLVVFLGPLDSGQEPEPEPEPEITPVAPSDERIAILTGTVWKPGPEYGYNYGSDDLYTTAPESHDDRLTFHADGKLTISAGEDGIMYTDKGFVTDFQATGNEGWILGTNADGVLCLQFTDGGFPLLRPDYSTDNQIYEVNTLTEETLRLHWPYGDGGCLVIILVPADEQ